MQTDYSIAKLNQRIISKPTVNSNISSSQHLFRINAQVDLHNIKAFEGADNERKCTVPATYTVAGDAKDESKTKILNKVPDDPSKTMRLVVENLSAEICINLLLRMALQMVLLVL